MNFFFKLHKNVQIRIITSFLSRIVSGMILPFMAVYFSDKLGKEITSILMVINVVVAIFVSFYGGYITDTIGRKKTIVIGQVLTVISLFFITIANSPFLDSPWLTFVMFLINGVGSGLIAPASDAMIIDSSNEENRAFIYSLNYWAINAGFMIGGIVGGILFKEHRFELYIALTIISIFTLFLIIKYIMDTYVPKEKNEKINVLKDVFKSYSKAITNKKYMIFLFASILAVTTQYQIVNYIPIHFNDTFERIKISILNLNFSIDGINMISVVNTENTILIVLFTIAITRFVTKSNPKKMLYIGTLLQAIGIGFMGYFTKFWLLFLFSFVQTIGEMIFIPVLQTRLANMMDEDNRGTYSAVNASMMQISRMFAAMGIGLSTYIGSFGMMLFIITLGIIACFIYGKSFTTIRE